jgi:hypothetical protein
MAQGRMKVKLTSTVMKNKSKKNEVKSNFTRSEKKSGVSLKKRKHDKADADRRLSAAINRNIEHLMTERATSCGAKLKVVKPPRQGEVKSRRMQIMNNLMTKVSKEFHTPSVDKMIEMID